jgi:hypothetical protein
MMARRFSFIYKLAFEPLTREETQLLSTMIGKWITHLEQALSELKQSSVNTTSKFR